MESDDVKLFNKPKHLPSNQQQPSSAQVKKNQALQPPGSKKVGPIHEKGGSK
jgi:hypothetical protein